MLGRAGGEVQYPVEQRGQLARQLAGRAGTGDDVREIARGGRLFDVVHGFHPQRTQQRVRRPIEQRDQASRTAADTSVEVASARATDSGIAIARFFGTSSPEQHLHQGAEEQDTAAPTATPAVLETPPPINSGEPAADEGLGKIAGQQAGHRDAQLRARTA
mgnify:CR=1 FL=1